MVLTIRDVARVAGVSPATVSRALRGLDNVDVRTRDRIVAIAREMDFSVSPTASRLATGRTGTIGVVTPFLARWYFTELFAGVHEVLEPHDVDLLIHVTEPVGPTGAPGAHLRMRRRVDGALVIGLTPGSAELEALKQLEIPMVLIGSATEGLPSVTIDDCAASRTAVEHLISLGHQRIALISGRELPTRIVPENDRLAGYLEAMRAHELTPDPALHRIGQFTTAGGEQAMDELLAGPTPPTAVFVMSDEMAYGALRSMARHGVTCGGDRAAGQIALIGFDGHDLADVFDLSTVAQPVRGLGRAGATMLMTMIEGVGEPQVVVLPTELVARRTTVPPRRPARKARSVTKP